MNEGRDEPDVALQNWLGPSAEEAVRRLCSQGPLQHFASIYEFTVEEPSKGFCSRFFTRDELDAMFDKGLWRPMERFMSIDPSGRQRIIDNARSPTTMRPP